MKFNKLNSLVSRGTFKTILGVGPMSVNCVNGAIELANHLRIPLLLIASRRQIECKEFGGGYVNNWTTEDFAKYVKERDKGDYIVLARDHGGPWQGYNETEIEHTEAMERAKVSFKADLDSGFDMIHIDPSVRTRSLSDIEKDVSVLYDYCESVTKSDDIIYECGTEETNGQITDMESFEAFVKCCSEISKKIKFVVGQTGTLVKETRNIGHFQPDQALNLANICDEYSIWLKEHNLDYVPESVLKQHIPCRVHAANVAPEFGVVETKRFLQALKEHKFKKERKRFLEIAYDSKKWEKWVVSDLSNEEKAIIAGHYVFTHPEVVEIYNKLNEKIYLDDILKNEVQWHILRYLKPFGWTH